MRLRPAALVIAAVVVLGAPVAAWSSGFALPDSLFALVLGLAYVIPGAVVVARADGHPVGWLLILIGILFSLSVASEAVPGQWQLWFASWSFPSVFGLFALLCLVVPSGRLPAGRGARIALGMIPAGLISIAFGAAPGGEDVVANPIGILPTWVSNIAYLTVAGSLVYAGASLLRRFRRSEGLVRAQLAPVAAGFSLLVFSIVVTLLVLLIWFPSAGGEGWMPALVSYFALPLTFMVSVLKYRLYDVGRLVRRTATYAVVIGVLVVTYAAAVLLFDGLLTPLFGEGDLPVALSTLVVFAAFRPVGSRVRHWVDAHFNRTGYDAEIVVESVRNVMRSTVERERIGERLVDSVAGALHPTSVEIWIAG